ncbi:3980_t:CDS:2, partial [Dentiscutata erythropus]
NEAQNDTITQLYINDGSNQGADERHEYKLVDFPIFSGSHDDDPVEWYEAFNRACISNNILENRRIAIVSNFLRGTALS